MNGPRKAAFLDRDGTIIVDTGYVGSPDDVQLLPSAAEGLAKLRELGYLLVIVTNQSGIARGYYDTESFRRVQERTESLLAEANVSIDAVYFCPHLPEGTVAPYNVECECRKPKPGMLTRAAQELEIDLSQSVMIGDSERDIHAGQSAGCMTILIDGSAADHAAGRGRGQHRGVSFQLAEGGQLSTPTASRMLTPQEPTAEPDHCVNNLLEAARILERKSEGPGEHEAHPESPSPTDWLSLPDEQFLQHCEERFVRSGGPGGQKRDKTSSGVRLAHLPTGLSAKATESRSQHENRRRALKRLRWEIALKVRQPVDKERFRPPAAFSAALDESGRINMSEKNESWPQVANCLLNLLEASQGRVSDAARLAGMNTGQFSRTLTRNDDLRTEANRIRERHGLKRLSPP